MGQVPAYTVVGHGRLAKHFLEYLRLLGVPANQWHRDLSQREFQKSLDSSNCVLLAISDRSIEPFFIEHRSELLNHQVFHASGSLIVDEVVGVHPLMTFGPNLQDLEFYRSINFVSANPSARLPGLENKVFQIPAESMTKYHMLCVLGGNFTQLLWSKVLEEFAVMDLPADIARLYAHQCVENIFSDRKAQTGPLVRGDQQTIEKHLEVLVGDPWSAVYSAFAEVYSKKTNGDR